MTRYAVTVVWGDQITEQTKLTLYPFVFNIHYKMSCLKSQDENTRYTLVKEIKLWWITAAAVLRKGGGLVGLASTMKAENTP